MKWVTRERPKTDRVACPWLIRRFVDPRAEFLYVAQDRVLDIAREVGGRSFDAPGADYTHRGDLCTFEVLIDEFELHAEPGLALLASIVHGADVSGAPDRHPASAGLLAIAEGLLRVEANDQEVRLIGARVYDALYAWCQAHDEPRSP